MDGLKKKIFLGVLASLLIFQCKLIPFDFIDQDGASTDGYNPLCLAFKLYNTSCPNCRADLDINSNPVQLYTQNSLKYPYYNSEGEPAPALQNWRSSSSEFLHLETFSDSGIMVFSKGLIFKFTDNLGNVYENYDDSFQLEQTVNSGSGDDSEIYGTVTGQLRNKSNFSDTINVTGKIRNFRSNYSQIECSNGV